MLEPGERIYHTTQQCELLFRVVSHLSTRGCPEVNMSAKQVIVVSGEPGVGKTTYVHDRKREGDVVWDWDAVVAALCCMPVKRLPRNDWPVKQLVSMGMWPAFARWVQQHDPDVTIWVIRTDRDRAAVIASQLGGTHVHLDRATRPPRPCKGRPGK